MRLTPRYDGRPVIAIGGANDSIIEPFLRQRRRLVDTLAGFDDEQWAHASRCDGWSAQDVVIHLVSTDQFWSASLASGIAGEPTRFLDGFDPNASPAALVDAADDVAPSETMAALATATETLCDLVEGMDDAALAALAEAPPGHIAASAVLHHALWDCWVHERDVLLPAGMDVDERDDEILACLRYGAALAPAFTRMLGDTRTGTLTLAVTDPDRTIQATIDDCIHVEDAEGSGDGPILRGRAVEVLEALSVRADLDHDFGPDHVWMIDGLRTVFDTV